MSRVGAVAGAFVVLVVVLFGIVAFDYIGWQNEGVRMQNGIVTQYEDNKNVYDNGWKTVLEKAQVPDMYRDDMQDIYDGVMTDRYGSDGSQALLQFITEHNPQVDGALYRDIQQSVETFRNRFTQAQTELNQRKLVFKNHYEVFPGSLYNSFASFPHIDLDEYSIVTSDKTEADFENKKSAPLELRPEGN